MRNGSNRRALLIFCLLGIVPEDVNVTICAGSGSPIVTSRYDGAARAYTNIARRLEGEKIPLMKI